MNTRPSLFTESVVVTLDEYGPNPPAEDLRQANPVIEILLAEHGEPPALFAFGHLPPVTASGVDADLLGLVPWPARIPMALQTSRRVVDELLERWTPRADTDLEMLASHALAEYQLHPANLEHIAILRAWAHNLFTLRAASAPAESHLLDAASFDALAELGVIDRNALAQLTEHTGLTWRDLLDAAPDTSTNHITDQGETP